jgi:hypothetical protein
MKINTRICLLLLAVMFAFLGTDAYGGSILHTKHNLSVSGPGPIKSPTEGQLTIFRIRVQLFMPELVSPQERQSCV